MGSASENVENEAERRNYFRLKDQVYIEYRKAEQEEVDVFLQNGRKIPREQDDTHFQLDTINRQIMPLMNGIRSEAASVATFLDGINRKIDILAGMMFFEQFRAKEAVSTYISTNTMDISEGGACFLSTKPLEMDTWLLARIVIVSFRFGLETYAKVAHCQPLNVSESGKMEYRIGLEFPYIMEKDRKHLTRYIFDRQRQLLRKTAKDKE